MSRRPPWTPERWRRVEAVLERVLDLEGAERAAAVAEACAGDDELRAEVGRLLEADARSPPFLEGDAAAFAAPALDSEGEERTGGSAGERVGGYRLLRELGAGGMSRVYLATREDADFDQRVAVKVLRAVGLDLEEGASRFRAERRILAALEHPSIARLHDGGTTAAGLPFLVMEAIDGRPITEHCAGRGLDERLDLVIQVCEAVQYAHQRLVVHRDLKPSNILVTRDGRLKLLDFGIAKLLDPATLGLGDAVPVTRTGLRWMTPEYAAPEQVQGREITTATDVYAIGVLLYELLTGHTPFRLAGGSPREIEDAVCHQEPIRPSAAADGTPARWRRRLEGDLDTIVLQALRKEPAERYGSARALAEDLERYRAGLPIAARAATAGYRLRKFVGRHRWGVAAAVVALLAAATFAASMAWQQHVTGRERDRAFAAEARAAAINRFLLEEVLGAASPEVAQGRQVEVLAAAARRVEGSFPDQPALEASVRLALGELSLRLGRLDDAEAHLTRAHSLFADALGARHSDTLVAARSLAELALTQGRHDDASRQASEVLALHRTLHSGELGSRGARGHPEIWRAEGILARADLERGEYRKAQHRLERLLGLEGPGSPAGTAVASRAGDSRDVAAVRDLAAVRIELEGILAEVYTRQRRWTDVEATATRVLQLQIEGLGANHPAVARTLTTLGGAQSRNKRYAEGQDSLERALALRERVLGEEHPDTLASLRALVVHHGERESYGAARRYAERHARLARRLYGPDHPETIAADENLGVIHGREGRHDLSVPIYRDTARRREETLGLTHPATVRSLRNLNGGLLALGRIDEARAVASRVLDSGRSRVAAGDDDATFLSDFAWFLVTCEPADLRDPLEALPLAERAVALTGRDWDDALDTLARVRYAMGDLDEAIALQREVLTLPASVASMDSEHHLVEYLEAKGDLAQIETDLRDHLERRRAARPPDDPILGASHRQLGLNLAKRGELEAARDELQRAVDQFSISLPAGDFQRLRAESELGEVLTRLGRYDEAEPILLSAAEGWRGRTWFRDPTAGRRARERVAELYRSWGREELAAEWAAPDRESETPR